MQHDELPYTMSVTYDHVATQSRLWNLWRRVTRWSDTIKVQFTISQRICLQPITIMSCLKTEGSG